MLQAKDCSEGKSPFIRIEGPGGQSEFFIDARLDERSALAHKLNLPDSANNAELLAAAFFRWGSELCSELLGDYALIAIDRKSGSIHAFRDHIGARPLFYAVSGGIFLFSSDIAGLVTTLGISTLSEEVLASEIVGGRRTDATRTFYQQIRRLPAGHRLEVRNGEAKLSHWWQPFSSPAASSSSIEALLDEGRDLLDRAVADRVGTDERIGIHVTGGLDSSSILALGMPRLRGAAAPPIGFGWQGPAATDEGPRVEAALALAPDIFRAPQLDDVQLLDLWRQDWTRHPSQWNLLHELAVQQDAERHGIGVMLSGWGGDEAISFNGRGLHAEYLRAMEFSKLASLSPRRGPAGMAAAIKAGLREALPPKDKQSSAPVGSFLKREFIASVDLPERAAIDSRSCRDAMQSLLQLGSVTARIEDWAISGRRHGIDYRYPLLDRRVMEFAYRLPSEHFRQGTTKRWFFREMMRGLLPEEIRSETSKLEDLRTRSLIARLQQSFVAIADEVEDRRRTLKRAEFFDMDRLIEAMRRPPAIGNPQLGHLRRALQFLDI
uniref:asparagine synthase-related protein n=1 Tax=Parerythrobacter lutipelagi TaxID=1964208 RepID=UPI0010F5E07E|nr:asparagine synthase-related protein [Parerythrobacter lutipelagi]